MNWKWERACAWLCTIALGGCTLQDVTVADPENIVVVEMTLRARAAVQTAVLHRTLVGAVDTTNAVLGARIEVTHVASGAVLRLNTAADSICIVPREDSKGLVRGTSYASSATSGFSVLPGETYALRITLADGGVMTGITHVPADFKMIRPVVATCSLPPDQTMRFEWTSSSDAWVYASNGVFRGLKVAFAARGHVFDFDEPLRLFGLSVSNRDTTLVFPSELGLFDRFDADKTALLTAMQQGLPPNVTIDITIAAADANYVNWERGGDFNPSGQVRIASVRGNGTGEFASIVPKSFQIRTAIPPRFPACQ